ncbi:hypothetical protein PoB_004932600 [Plakobranchus ocellatus]|uniref:Uncharacterized protein n=1 Tax=Plakobranchus ocellatus TaxID=259542 RepID=A0AAV4BQR9_9GAST|nr:hypothetical protein PoB_004932600 [Plakobranchus ocellatus]
MYAPLFRAVYTRNPQRDVMVYTSRLFTHIFMATDTNKEEEKACISPSAGVAVSPVLNHIRKLSVCLTWIDLGGEGRGEQPDGRSSSCRA